MRFFFGEIPAQLTARLDFESAMFAVPQHRCASRL